MTSSGMFDPLPIGSSAGRPPAAPAPDWRVFETVPEGAPPPPAKHPKFGSPAIRWTYSDAAGQVRGFVCRFDQKGGRKEIRGLVFAEHPKLGRQWRWLGFPAPRPLYGLDRLAARPEAPVIICEGEKAADAAGELLSNYIAVTSPGGSKAAAKADWSALACRSITIWPDADEAGQAYAHHVVLALGKLPSPPSSVAVLKPPDGVANGWDAADALVSGWTPGQAVELVAGGAPARAEDAVARTRKPAARDWLIGLIRDAELWHDAERIAFATVLVDGHRENHEIGSRGFRNWLAWRAYEAIGVSPVSEAIEAALRVAEALALNRGPCRRTFRRVAEYEGRIYLDLGCARWRAVEVTARGWGVVEQAPVKFLRSRGLEALPEPEAGGTIELLREFVNVESDADFRLLLAWVISTFLPQGPFPILTITGQQGASKSTAARICRRLIDPNASPIRSVPKDQRDLIVSAFNSWLLVNDNMSSLPVWLSDALCRLSTGGGYATRQLHTDRDETIFSAQRPIVLNGISDLATRGDLAERVLSITLPPLADDRRREEREFWAAFDQALPQILGALLDAVAAGLRRLPDTILKRRPRMADFATWVEACSAGFGWGEGQFLRDYEENCSDVVAAAAEASPLVPAIEAVLGRGGLLADGFDGTSSELLTKLNQVCSETERKARWYPTNASQVGSALRRVGPLLKSRGIEFLTYKERDRKRTRRNVLRCISEAVFSELQSRVVGRGSGGLE